MTMIKTKLKFGAISASNLNAICKRNINRLIIGQLNINSLNKLGNKSGVLFNRLW